ncbi:hypothetical protein SPRG_03245 [Saprolegnia parasitica CBS 223.65]|uniref:DNA2/NAM7 helicase-like C-terminal domain-containing protein n=1 Tax=Saprolegnia parasitica (strain CBS 223.65) TaxID=695850 RepID=A0A067CND2_SAPPC|nr:hypothetical protein SPRG_03245 [Saprolegnia parasitica CBS 223.65]KDO32028.1 hypothetical protein SPRG_03245 [Saprolegnia parasitica CBS 223.65]|eukprot:XP_012197218.1 hypothetical protein SPRG_03245 [Saprolegnia parasitica CBS 223.65]
MAGRFVTSRPGPGGSIAYELDPASVTAAFPSHDVSTALKAMVEVSLRDVGSLLPRDIHDVNTAKLQEFFPDGLQATDELVVLPYKKAHTQMVGLAELPDLPLGHRAAFVGQGKLELAPGIDPTRFIAIGAIQLDLLLMGKHRLKKWKRDVEKLLEFSAAIPVDPPTTPQRIKGNPLIMASPSPRRIGGRPMTSPSARSLPSRSPQMIEFIPQPSSASSPAKKKTKAGARLQAVVELDPIETMKTAFNDAKTPQTPKTQKSSTQTRDFFFQVLGSEAPKFSTKMSTTETYQERFVALLVAEARAAIIAGQNPLPATFTELAASLDGVSDPNAATFQTRGENSIKIGDVVRLKVDNSRRAIGIVERAHRQTIDVVFLHAAKTVLDLPKAVKIEAKVVASLVTTLRMVHGVGSIDKLPGHLRDVILNQSSATASVSVHKVAATTLRDVIAKSTGALKTSTKGKGKKSTKKQMSKEDEDVVLTLLTDLTKMKISVETLEVTKIHDVVAELVNKVKAPTEAIAMAAATLDNVYQSLITPKLYDVDRSVADLIASEINPSQFKALRRGLGNLETGLSLWKGRRASPSKGPLPSVLVTSDSNAAIDEIIERIFSVGIYLVGHTTKVQARLPRPEGFLAPPLTAVKMGSRPGARDIGLATAAAQYKKEIKDACEKLPANDKRAASLRVEKDLDKWELLARVAGKANIIFATHSSCAGADMTHKLRQSGFDAVIVDECGQATEPSSLLALLAQAGRFFFVGDTKQIAPTVVSDDAKTHGLDVSLMERLEAYLPVTMLTEQHRMHPFMSAFTAKAFYDAALTDAPAIARRVLAQDASMYAHPAFQPLTVVDIAGVEKRVGTSKANDAEVKFCIDQIEQLMMTFPRVQSGEWSIGIITPYKPQVHKIVGAINAKIAAKMEPAAWSSIEVSSVDGFQGREKDIILVSCVTSGNVGFLDDDRRTNVMTSRGRRFCIVNCNASALQGHATWRMLFEHAKDKCAFVGAGAKPFATVWAETEADDALKARVNHQHATLRATLEQRDEKGKANPDDEEKAAPNEEESKDEMPSDTKRKRRGSPKVHVSIL